MTRHNEYQPDRFVSGQSDGKEMAIPVHGWLRRVGDTVTGEFEGAYLERGCGHPLDNGPPYVLWITGDNLSVSDNWIGYAIEQEGDYLLDQDVTGVPRLRLRVDNGTEPWLVILPFM